MLLGEPLQSNAPNVVRRPADCLVILMVASREHRSVLQVLTHSHRQFAYTLGKRSAQHHDKLRGLQDQGAVFGQLWGHTVLPGCHAYLLVQMEDSMAAGDHTLALCRVNDTAIGQGHERVASMWRHLQSDAMLTAEAGTFAHDVWGADWEDTNRLLTRDDPSLSADMLAEPGLWWKRNANEP